MMKSFFKKLAFVMALAMVVSLAAPAAKTAVAAEEKTLAIGYQSGMAITEVNLANVGDFEDLRFLYAPANWKELGVKWTSSNENVVTVDDSGLVTAVAAGSATVSVAVGTETAAVVVNVVDLPTYEVTIGIPAEDLRNVTAKELEIGESVDFAFYGIKDYSRDKIGVLPRYLCTWQSDDTTVLSKDDDAGNFTALKAGTAKVTLTVANVMTGQTHNVIPVNVTVKADEPEATPAPSMEVKNTRTETKVNTTQNKVELVFDKPVDIELADVEMFRLFYADNDADGNGLFEELDAENPYENFYVFDVKANKDKTVYTVTTFDDFADNVNYEVRVKGYEKDRFTASVGPVAKVIVNATEAWLASDDCELVPSKLSVALYDKNGVDVTTRRIEGVANNDTANISYDLVEYNSDYSLSYDILEFYENTPAKVTATYQNAGVDPITSAALTVVPTAKAAYGVAEIVAWTLIKEWEWADWSKINHTAPAGEDDYVIVTLLRDTRGKYFVTHENSATGSYNEWKAGYWNNEEQKWYSTYWTEASDQEFWMNGLYVEYKAMNPDKMLVEDYGEIQTYEMGTARYSLYLYNYNQYGSEFVEELDSNNLTVCHPMELKNITVDSNSVAIMMNTEDTTKDENEANSYYSLFSKTKVGVNLMDIHPNTFAKPEHADAAEFEITLTSASLKNESADSYNALKYLVEVEYLNDLYNHVDVNGKNGIEAWEHYRREITVEANDFDPTVIAYRNQVKFTITEKTTNSKVYVTINLKKLVRDEIKNINGVVTYSSDVALVEEIDDKLKTKVYFEKFDLTKRNLSLDMASGNSVNISLTQSDKNGNLIGLDSNLFVAQTLNANWIQDVPYSYGVLMPTDPEGLAQVVQGLKKGDRVIEVKGPDGKVYAMVGTDYANPAYSKKLADTPYANASTTSSLGVEVTTQTKFNGTLVQSASGSTIAYNRYDFLFRTTDSDNEFIYAKEGKYTITVKTVESIDYDFYQWERAYLRAADGKFVKDANGNKIALVETGYWNNDLNAWVQFLMYKNADGKYAYASDSTLVEADVLEAMETPWDKWEIKYNAKADGTYKLDDGGYKVAVRNANFGKITWASSTNLKKTATVDVTNTNAKADYAGRDLTRISDSLTSCVNQYANIDSDYTMRGYILDAFNFTLGGNPWKEDIYAGQLDEDNILYYTYTVTPTNKQIVINTVTFKVMEVKNGAETGNWYRTTATVNKSLTFDYE